ATVARFEESSFVESESRLRFVGIALDEHWSPYEDFALLSLGDRLPRPTDHLDLAASHRGSFSVGELFVGVELSSIGDHRTLGHPVAMKEGHAQFVANPPEHIGWHRGATPPDHPQLRGNAPQGILALLGEQSE